MGTRRTIPIKLPPGIVKRKGNLTSEGRYVDGDKVRFNAGQPEQIGGWSKYTTGGAFRGIARAGHSWNDLTSRTVTAIGTTTNLYALDGANGLVDITPVKSTASLTAAFSTTAGSANVTVYAPAHGAANGQAVVFSAVTVGGLAMDAAPWVITGIIDADHFTFAHSNAAASTAGPTGNATASYLIPPGPADPAGGFGWGVGGWGVGTWGTPRSATNIFFEPYTWSLAHFGRILLAAPFGGTLYGWDPTTIPTPRATPVVNAPGAMRGVFVTPERFVIAFGASPDAGTTFDPMLLRWCSQGDYTIWTAAQGNTANARRLTEGKKIMGGGAVGNGVSLIWTDTALYVHQYTGSRYVFDTRLAGTSAGLAGPHAFCFARGRAYWFGSSAFQTFGGSVSAIRNSEDILGWVLEQLRSHYETKTLCFFNERYNEVWWLFVSTDASEPSFYVAHDLDDGSWTKGALSRTAALQQDGGDSRPILAGTDGWLYLHEDGRTADGKPIAGWVQSGPFQVEEGQQLVQILGFIPDFAEQYGDVQLLLEARDRASSAPHERVSVAIAPAQGIADVRTRGRVMSFTLQSSGVGGYFALGSPAFEIISGGKKR